MCCEQNVVELKVKAARQDCTSTESLIYVRMMREEVEEGFTGEIAMESTRSTGLGRFTVVWVRCNESASSARRNQGNSCSGMMRRWQSICISYVKWYSTSDNRPLGIPINAVTCPVDTQSASARRRPCSKAFCSLPPPPTRATMVKYQNDKNGMEDRHRKDIKSRTVQLQLLAVCTA